MPTSAPSDLIRSADAVGLLGVSRRTLTSLTAAGRLTVYRRPGERSNLHSRAEVEALALPKAVTR